MATKDIKEAAAAHGHKWRTVERAKKTLGIAAAKATGGPTTAWSWSLPVETKTANTDRQDRHHD
jgi:hypothetical protein